jgi:hypothetical protein
MRVAYDVDAIAESMRKAGFAKRLYENLYSGTRIGGELTKPESGGA